MKEKNIILNTKIIAIVGLSPKEERVSNRIGKFLQEKNFKIIPVYPRGESILGEKVYRTITDINFPIDMILVFRKSEDVLDIVKDGLHSDAKYLWMQEGIENLQAKKLAESNGMEVIMDRCIYKSYLENM